jgi:hypothetical protein
MYEYPLSEYPFKAAHTEVKINGEWITYILMSQNFNSPYQRGTYLGVSNEIRINGVVQRPRDVEYHFWKKAD